jgi:hypothetical protein
MSDDKIRDKIKIVDFSTADKIRAGPLSKQNSVSLPRRKTLLYLWCFNNKRDDNNQPLQDRMSSSPGCLTADRPTHRLA